MMVKRLSVLLALIGASFMYLVTRGASSSAANNLPMHNPTPTPTPSSVPAVATPSQTSSGMMSGGMMPAKQKMMGQYRDGTYKGSVADAYYGLVQVQASIMGGKLADVTFLSYPSDHSTSRFINSQAMPMLTEEAIVAQSADVNIISGATETSLAFRQSLASALALAKN